MMSLSTFLRVPFWLAAASLLPFSGCQSGGVEHDPAYVARIEAARVDQQDFMRTNPASPFVREKVPFDSLRYFPIDPRYQVRARLKDPANKQVVTLATSDGRSESYLPYAYARFELLGVECQLLILESMQMGPQRGTLFLAFADSTSGQETYGAGRYLEVKKVRGATHTDLDFNLAYNPYCAYVDHYSCPFPPPENVLPLRVAAGERKYQQD